MGALSGNFTLRKLGLIRINGTPQQFAGPGYEYTVSLSSSGNGWVDVPASNIEDGLFHVGIKGTGEFPTETYALENGSYFTIEYGVNSSHTRARVSLYDSNNTLITFFSMLQTDSYIYFTVVELEDSGGNKYRAICTSSNYNNLYRLQVQSASTEWSEILNAPIVPLYTWYPWDTISGSDGEYEYRMPFTKAKPSVLTDLGTGKISTSADFDRIASQSSIWAKLQNMTIGQETPIAYSGRGRLTLTLSTTGVSPGNYNCIYKFYIPDATTPFYTLERTIIYSGTNPYSNIYLSFAYDNEQLAAVFLPVEYKPDGVGSGYLWGGVNPSTDEMLYLWLWLQLTSAGTDTRPYDTGSTDNGGDPAGPQPGDHMGQTSVPTLSGMGAKLFTVYCPTEEQLEDIAAYLWDNNVITNIRKYFSNFADNIISLYVLPYSGANLPTKNFKVGNMESEDITGVKYLNTRFVSLDMGTAIIKNEYDSYLDYSPYTKIECFLPGIGTVALDADDIMSPTDPDTGTLKTKDEIPISLKYTLDLMTGIIVAFIFIDGEQRYQFSGKLGYEIPLTGQTYANMVRGFVQAAAGLVGTVATGGLSAPIQAASVSAAVSGTVNAMKPEIHRSGNLSGDASMLGEKTPYLIYHKPNKPLLENQQIFTGFPSYKSGKLSEFEGMTSVIDAHVEGISCTEAERAEILQLLKSGVIL